MRSLIADLLYAIRLHTRRPGLALAAILVLGLGLGANLTIFQLFDTIVVQPMPKIRDAGALVWVGRTQRDRGFANTSYPDFADLRAATRPGLDLAGQHFRSFSVSLDAQTNIRLAGAVVSDNYFDVLGVNPRAGRFFRDAGERVAIISDALWERHWKRDPKAIGARIRVNTVDFVVAGVAEAGFRGSWIPVNAMLWVPLTALDELDRSFKYVGARDATWLHMFGRLRAGTTRARADEQLAALGVALREKHAGDFKDMKYRTARFNALGGDDDQVLTFLAILAALTVLASMVVCANVANLLLAAAAARRREIAIRLSIGSGRWRVLRLMLVEGFALAIGGAVAGLLASQWGAEMLASTIPDDEGGRILIDFVFRPSLVGVAFGLGLLATLVIALPAAWQSARTDILTFLKAGEASAQARTRLRGGLAIVQIALCVVLLSAAGLLIRSISLLGQTGAAVASEELRLATLDLQPSGYDAQSGPVFLVRLLDRLRGAPGIENAALNAAIPFSGNSTSLFALWGGAAPKGRWFEHEVAVASPGFFRTLGATLLAGRDFEPADRAGRPLVAIVNQTFARRMFPDRDPIGQIIETGNERLKAFQIIGLAPDGLGSNPAEPRPVIYFSLWQIPEQGLRQTIFVRGRDAAKTVRAVVRELDARLPLFNETSLKRVFEESYFQQKLAGAVALFAGFMAMLVATIGLYGLVAFQVSQRTREVGLRLALGASPRDVLGIVMRGGLVLAGAGLMAGLALTVALTRFLSSVLYGVRPAEPAVLLGAGALLTLATLAASWIPARRAARIDPARALRWE